MSKDEDGNAPAEPTRNSAATIARILAGAEAEFGTKGLDGAKVEDIARAAGISKQLIYHYFNGKDDLYSEMLAKIAQFNYEKLLEVDYENLEPVAAIRDYLHVLFDQYSNHPFSATVTVDQGLHSGAQVRYNRNVDRMRSTFRKRLGDALDRGKAAGLFTADMDVEMLHFLSVVMITGCLSLRKMFTRYAGALPDEGAPQDADFWRGYVTEFFLRAMRP
ncbi:MAG: hypothetical protein JWR77_947 [Rhizorhabdus sp.]|nr:hypothetical protein [Rhizorhabdus sp.]